MADTMVDAKGANCTIPIPVAKKMLFGGMIQSLATDPDARADFRSQSKSQQLVEQADAANVYSFLIKRLK